MDNQATARGNYKLKEWKEVIGPRGLVHAVGGCVTVDCFLSVDVRLHLVWRRP